MKDTAKFLFFVGLLTCGASIFQIIASVVYHKLDMITFGVICFAAAAGCCFLNWRLWHG